MTMGALQRKILSWLRKPQHRQKGYETRSIAQAVYHTDWATQEQVASVRQALNRLAAQGVVVRFGFFVEWHLREVEADSPGRTEIERS